MEDEEIIKFLKDFVPDNGSPTGESDNIQLRNSIVGGYKLCQGDVQPETTDWVMNILEQRNCPYKLAVVLAEEVSTYVKDNVPHCENGSEDDPESEFCLDSGLLYSSAVQKLNELCNRFRNESEKVLKKTSLVQSPHFQTSTNAIRNTRRKMEDRHVQVHDLNALCGLKNMPPQSFYAIYDGHAGIEAASFTAAHLHWKIARHPDFASDVEKAMREAFIETDNDFLERAKRDGIKSGCTAICCLIRDKVLHVGWLGDSQAVLVRGGVPIPLVEPHKPERETERQRIEELGGYVMHVGTWRVNGTLAVSRAIGDPDHKPYVSSEADIQTIQLDGTEDYLVLGCDGLWDRLSPHDMALNIYHHTSQKNPDPLSCATHLVQLSKDQGSTDNITSIVIFFKNPSDINFVIPETPPFTFASNPVGAYNGNSATDDSFKPNWADNLTGKLEEGKSIYVYNSGLTVGDPIGSNGPEEIFRPFTGVTLEKTAISELPTPPIEDLIASEHMMQRETNIFCTQQLSMENQNSQAQVFAAAILESAREESAYVSSQLDNMPESRVDDDEAEGSYSEMISGSLDVVPENEDFVPQAKPWMLQVQHSVHQNEVDYLPNPDNSDFLDMQNPQITKDTFVSSVSQNPFDLSGKLEEVPLEINDDRSPMDPSPFGTGNNPFTNEDAEGYLNEGFLQDIPDEDAMSNLSEEAPSTLRALHGIQEMIGISETVPGSKAAEPAGVLSENPFGTTKEVYSAFEEIIEPEKLVNVTSEKTEDILCDVSAEESTLVDLPAGNPFSNAANVFGTAPLERDLDGALAENEISGDPTAVEDTVLSAHLTENIYGLPNVDVTSEDTLNEIAEESAFKQMEKDTAFEMENAAAVSTLTETESIFTVTESTVRSALLTENVNEPNEDLFSKNIDLTSVNVTRNIQEHFLPATEQRNLIFGNQLYNPFEGVEPNMEDIQSENLYDGITTNDFKRSLDTAYSTGYGIRDFENYTASNEDSMDIETSVLPKSPTEILTPTIDNISEQVELGPTIQDIPNLTEEDLLSTLTLDDINPPQIPSESQLFDNALDNTTPTDTFTSYDVCESQSFEQKQSTVVTDVLANDQKELEIAAEFLSTLPIDVSADQPPSIAILAPILSMETMLPKPSAAEDTLSAPVVQLGKIPDGVPEADGVTEDSDSEKDGGWSYVRGSHKGSVEAAKPLGFIDAPATEAIATEQPVHQAEASPELSLQTIELEKQPPPPSEMSDFAITIPAEIIKVETAIKKEETLTSKVSSKAVASVASKLTKSENKTKLKESPSLCKTSPIKKVDVKQGTPTTPKPFSTLKKTPSSSTPKVVARTKPVVASSDATKSAESKSSAPIKSATLKPAVKSTSTTTNKDTLTKTTTVRKSATTSVTATTRTASVSLSNATKATLNGASRPSPPTLTTTVTRKVTSTVSKAPLKPTATVGSTVKSVPPAKSATTTRPVTAATTTRPVTAKPATSKIASSTLARPASAPVAKKPSPLTQTLPSKGMMSRPKPTTGTVAGTKQTTSTKVTKESANKNISKTSSTTTMKSSTITRTTLGKTTGTASKTLVGSKSLSSKEPKPIKRPTEAAESVALKENGMIEKESGEQTKAIPISILAESEKTIEVKVTEEKFSIDEHTKELQAVDSGLASPESPESPQNGIEHHNGTVEKVDAQQIEK